jgi:hypothetical protein
MKLPFRCWQCWKRLSCRTPPIDRYCPACGKVGLYLDKTRLARNKAYQKLCLCYCDGYWFPHRKGSLACKFGKNYAMMQVDPEEVTEYTLPAKEEPF